MNRTGSALVIGLAEMAFLKLAALTGNVDLSATSLPLWYQGLCIVTGLVNAVMIVILVVDFYKGRP